MINFKRSFFWIVMLCITTIACNDPSTIGSGLITDEFSDITFTDTVTVQTLNVPQDSIFTYTNAIASQPLSYLCGSIDDPVFGKYSSELYLDFLLNTTSVAGGFDFENATFDSLVLSIAYDSIRTYGDTLNPQTIEVYRLTESMDNNVEFYYSDTEFQHDMTPIGTMSNFLPRPKSRIFSSATDSIGTSANIRIPLDDALGMELMNFDSTTYASSENFQESFKGIKINSAIENSNMLGFNLNSSLTYMRLYYTQDTSDKFITFIVGGLSVKYNEFNHDYSGSLAETFINDQAMSDSLVFVQGMSGMNVKIDFPYLNNFEDIIINKAELEFTVADLVGDDTTIYQHPIRLGLTYQDGDGDFFFIDDVNLAIAVGNLNGFGGLREGVDENGNTVYKYKMNISSYLQDILECSENNELISNCLSVDAIDNSLYLQVYFKNQFANRGIFYGGGHSQYPVKLHLTYTQQ